MSASSNAANPDLILQKCNLSIGRRGKAGLPYKTHPGRQEGPRNKRKSKKPRAKVLRVPAGEMESWQACLHGQDTGRSALRFTCDVDQLNDPRKSHFVKTMTDKAIYQDFAKYVTNIDPLPTRYGGKTNVTILPGVGIGPEIMETTLEILKAAQAPLSYEILTLSTGEGDDAAEEFQNVLISIRRNRVALKGNIEIKSKNPHAESRNILLRKTLDLFVYVLWCKTFPALKNKFGEIDVVVIRQNTEGEYLMLEHEPRPGSVESLKVITRYASERLARFAFNYALEHNRKHITVVHNANVQKETEGLFVKAALTVSMDYPMIKVSILEVGVLTANIVMNPQNYDIILATNLNGSMISNLLNGMLGGPGLSAGTNLGENGIAIFEPGARNKGSSIVGTGTANPIGMIMAGINLLDYLGYHKTSQMLQHSVHSTLVNDRVLTRDLGGTATTKEITANVIRHVRKQLLPKTGTRTDRMHRPWRNYCDVPAEFDPAEDK